MRGALIGRKDFEASRSFHWTRETSSRKGHGGLPKETRGVSYVEKRKKEDNECVKKRLVLMCEKVVHEKDVCKK